MRFLRRNSADSSADTIADDEVTEVADEPASKAHTPGKGRATPKRREAENRKRGPVAPPPRTTREAIRRSRGNKEERQAQKAKRREHSRTQRQRMMQGDERALPPRERGPVKAYVRDLVDSRRSVLGLFMPLAILVFLSLFLQSIPAAQSIATLICLMMFVVMIFEGVITGRRIARLAREKFPKETIKGASLGWYAFSRGVQLRALRIPKPRVKPGDKIR